MKNLLLAGYLGAGNLGDDAVMLGLVHGLGGASYSVTVLSGAPEETHRLYGFPSVPRRDNRLIEAAIIKCDALVFPGGSIFQDASSMMSPTYYAGLIETAKKHGKKVVLVGQGILALLAEPVATATVRRGRRGYRQHAVLPADQCSSGSLQGAVELIGDAVGGGVVAEHADQPGDRGGDRGEGEGEPGSQVHGLRRL